MGFILKNMDAVVLPIKMVLFPYGYNWSLTKSTLAYRIFLWRHAEIKKTQKKVVYIPSSLRNIFPLFASFTSIS